MVIAYLIIFYVTENVPDLGFFEVSLVALRCFTDYVRNLMGAIQ